MTKALSSTATTSTFIFESRRVGTPLIAVETLDQLALVQAAGSPASKTIVDPTGKQPVVGIVEWDVLRGYTWLNDEGKAALDAAYPDHEETATDDPTKPLMWEIAAKLPKGTAVFMMNAHRFISLIEVVQGLLNLRDRYKTDARTWIMLGPSFEMPAELNQIVATFSEPLPTDAEYQALAVKLIEGTNLRRKEGQKIPKPTAADMASIVSACRGLVHFPAEQALVMSQKPTGYDLGQLLSYKKRTVESTQGLEFEFDTGVTLADVIGLDAMAAWASRVGGGPCRPLSLLFLDELEKMVAGSSGDSSGVSQRQLGSFLTWTAVRRMKGILLVGPPGVGKSYLAEAMANSMSIPILKCNFGAMMGSLVGETEQNMRVVQKVVDGISGSDTLMVATCNRLEALPPELRDRFSLGTWYVDLPTPEAQAQMWAWYTKRGKHMEHPSGSDYDFGPPPEATHYTGRDISNIVDAAWQQQVTLREAARTSNVSVAQSQPGMIRKHRDDAHGVFLSAHRPGPYYKPDSDEARKEQHGGRMVTLEEE